MTPARWLGSALLAASLLLATAVGAAAEWDQAKVTSLANSLVGATSDLYDAFFKQPKVTGTPVQARNYDRLKREIRHIKQAARGLAGDLERGENREQTQHAYESVISSVNWARERARSVLITQDVTEKADVARKILAEIGAYYEPAQPVPVED
jgi:hypothetical protein